MTERFSLEELKNREEKASIEELEEVVVLVKQKEQVSSIVSALEEYGLKAEETIYSSSEDEGDTVLLFRRPESN